MGAAEKVRPEYLKPVRVQDTQPTENQTEVAPAAPADPAFVVDGTVTPAAPWAEGTEEAAVKPPLKPLPPFNVWVLQGVAKHLKRVTAWDERPASLSERVEHSITGDWATSESKAKRVAHLVATLALLPFGIVGASLVWSAEKPERGWLVLIYVFLVIRTFVI